MDGRVAVTGGTSALAGPAETPRRQKWHATPMALEMRDTCERCGGRLALDGPAMICSYECTFCTTCSTEMTDTCPNCSGRLVLRPPRAVTAAPPQSAERTP